VITEDNKSSQSWTVQTSESVVVGARARVTTRTGLHWREFVLLLVVVDAALVVLALLAAVRFIDATRPDFSLTAHFEIWLVGTWVLWLFSLRVGGAYDLLDPDVGPGSGGSLARSRVPWRLLSSQLWLSISLYR
jgi:hypothetical protein